MDKTDLIEMMTSGLIDCRILKVHPDDKIIITSQEWLSPDFVVELIKKFSAFFPGHTVLVFHSGATINVNRYN